MTYRYSNRSRTTLPPPAELVGRSVTWQPRTNGHRSAAVRGSVQSFDPTARTLVIRVQQAVSMWQKNPHRDVVVPLSQGPFTVTD